RSSLPPSCQPSAGVRSLSRRRHTSRPGCRVPKRIWTVGGPVGTALRRGRGQDRLSGSVLLRGDDTLKVAHEPRKGIILPTPQKQGCRLEGEGGLKTR